MDIDEESKAAQESTPTPAPASDSVQDTTSQPVTDGSTQTSSSDGTLEKSEPEGSARPDSQNGGEASTDENKPESEERQTRKRKSASTEPAANNDTPNRSSNRSASNRSSKRVKARSDEQTLDSMDVAEDKSFFEQLTSFLSLCNMKFESVIPVFLDQDYPHSDQYLYDFKLILQGWDDSQAEILLKNEKPSKKSSASNNNQSILQTLDFAALGNDNIVKAPSSLTQNNTSDRCINYIQRINSGDYHLQEVRFEFIYALLSEDENGCSLLDEFWPTAVADTVRQILDNCESLIYSNVKSALLSTTVSSPHLEVCEGFFELLVDYYLTSASSLDAKTGTKANVKELEATSKLLFAKVDRWRQLFCDFASLSSPESVTSELLLRHKWVSIFLEARSCTPAANLRQFQQSKSMFEEHERKTNHPFVMEFTNFSNIPRLSIESCDTQISKYRAAAVFARVFDMEVKSVPSLDERGSNESTPETERDVNDEAKEDIADGSLHLEELSKVDLLESILLDEHKERLPEHEAVSQFLSHASIQFKFKLWSMLLDAYNDQGESKKSFEGYLRIFESSVDEITGDMFLSKSDHQRSTLILTCLSSCFDICKMLQRLIAADEELLLSLSPQRASAALETTIQLLRMLHIYNLFDDAISNNNIARHSHNSWKVASRHFEDLICHTWSIFYFFYRTCLPEQNRIPDTLNDIMSIVHDAIGSRGYCGKANGVFLDMVIRELSRLDWSESEQDMIQCLHCRYDLTLASDTFSPFDHYAGGGELDRKTALMLSKFIMRMILNRKNLNQSLLRNEVKIALDEFYQAIGDPDPALILPVAHNFSILNDYLASSLTRSLFRTSLTGGDKLAFASSPNEIVKVGEQGFYYILGYQQLSQFRIRKRSGPGRTEDAEDAIKFFQFDIVCNTNRFESWVGLAQAFDALADEDLTWDAENFNTVETRRALAVNQRKSILACAMAAKVFLTDNEKQKQGGAAASAAMSAHYEQLASTLWGLYAKLIYNASRPPMQMEAFTDIPEQIFCGFEGLYKRPKAQPVSEVSIFKMVDICLILAIKSNPTDWNNYYLRAKVLYKLKSPAEEALEQIILATKHLSEKGGGSATHYPIIEPHYKLLSLVIKYVSKGQLRPEQGLEYLKHSAYYDEKPDSRIQPMPASQPGIDFERLTFYLFFSRCLSTLVKLRAVDKRKWHHRPTYRIAKLLSERFGDAQAAKEEMSGFFPLKSISKAPIHIWKPDLERSGEQFEFRSRYIIYYVDLLKQTGDFESLCLLARKLRKFSTGTARHQEAWEYVCLGTCFALKQFLGIPTKFTEQVINKLLFEEFNAHSQNLLATVEKAKSENELPLLVGELDAIAEIRRLNNGFGSTAALDDTYVAVYLKIYLNYLESINPTKAETAVTTTPVPATPTSSALTNGASSNGLLGATVPIETTAQTVSTPSTPSLTVPSFSSRISIQSLVSPEPSLTDLTSAPSTPPARPSTPPKPPTSGAATPQKEKVRVTKRDIIIRITPFLKAVVSKSGKQAKEKGKDKEKAKEKKEKEKKEKQKEKEKPKEKDTEKENIKEEKSNEDEKESELEDKGSDTPKQVPDTKQD
ncbi:Hir3p [Sugiyamaella lignohabitans]|uniref:Hir3p n=1 Tax=Sugiyamaella lignohabitans TaxID=796027 RepID=A0A167CZ84_9ASCO|nr:Hir3p [Sugiyamaella lignohabitans]ANB12285.1 Hir3p [Sugiyamaella lignohabitans]